MMTTKTLTILNVIGLKLGWVACVIGAAMGYPLVGLAITLAVVGLHIAATEERGPELILLAMIGFTGTAWDSLLVSIGWFVYPNGTLVAGLAPYWITSLWLLLATALNTSLRMLKGRYAISAAIGAIASPLSFYAGSKLGAVDIVQLNAGLVAQSIGWAVLLPFSAWLSVRLDGHHKIYTSTSPTSL